jgi:hypothetical protein
MWGLAEESHQVKLTTQSLIGHPHDGVIG